MNKTLILIIFFFTNLVIFSGQDKNKDLRIISINPAATESLYLLNAGNLLVADSTYCDYPEEARHKVKVGNLLEIDVEKIVSLKPDIIFMTTMTPLKSYIKLKSLNLNILTIDQPKNFIELCDNFFVIGKAVGKEAEALKIISQTKSEFSEIKNDNSGKPRQKVFIQIGSKPLFGVLKDSYLNDLIDASGGDNIIDDSPNGLYSMEKVLKKNPDVIIITEMGIAGDDEKKEWKKFSSLNAAKNGKIFIVDPNIVCRPVPTMFIEALNLFNKLLHE